MKIVIVQTKSDFYYYNVNDLKSISNHEYIIVRSLEEALDIKGDIIFVGSYICPSNNYLDFDKKYRKILNKNYTFIVYDSNKIDNYKKRINYKIKLDKYSNIIFNYHTYRLGDYKEVVRLINDFYFKEKIYNVKDFQINKINYLYDTLLKYKDVGINTLDLERITNINKRSVERYMLILSKIKKDISYYNHKWYVI